MVPSARARTCARTLALTLTGITTVAWAPTAAAAPLSRPHGNVMGDGLQGGLDFSIGEPAPQAGQVCAAGPTLPGIDVSYYQGDIDWNQVAASGIVFAWTRASHGLQFDDPQLTNNLNGARAAGVHIGVYQYFEPTQDPIAQADKLLALTGPLQPGDLPPMLDVESADTVGKAAYADAIRAWVDHVEAATGVVPFIYSGYYYWNDNVGAGEFADHPLVVPNYNKGCPLVPDTWATWTVHQYCDCGSVPGIAGNVDTDTFNGDLATLEGYLVGGGECGDSMCTAGEDTASCPGDCPPCGVVAAAGGDIDNDSACLELYGDLQYWRQETVGQGGSLTWTNVTDYADPSNYAIWRMSFAETGTYELETWIEKPFGETRKSVYQVNHAGGETLVPIDQSLATGWVNLGEYTFNAATDHFVRIDDNTGESNDLELSLAADVMRITRVDLDPPPTTSTDGSTSSEPTTGETETPATTDESSTTQGVSSSEDTPPTSDGTSGGSSGTDSAGVTEDEPDDGCGCRNSPRPGGFSLLALGILALVRRRRRT